MIPATQIQTITLILIIMFGFLIFATLLEVLRSIKQKDNNNNTQKHNDNSKVDKKFWSITIINDIQTSNKQKQKNHHYNNYSSPKIIIQKPKNCFLKIQNNPKQKSDNDNNRSHVINIFYQ